MRPWGWLRVNQAFCVELVTPMIPGRILRLAIGWNPAPHYQVTGIGEAHRLPNDRQSKHPFSCGSPSRVGLPDDFVDRVSGAHLK